MILVTLGTQDKRFERLLNKIEKMIEKSVITDEVIVQAGCTTFQSKFMKIFDSIPMNEFEQLVKKCDLLITHGGVGSIITGLKAEKKVIAIPRLKKYSEAVNDHQIQIVEKMDEEGYIVGVTDLSKFEYAIKKVKKFKPKKFVSNTNNMIDLILEYIDNN